MPQTLWAGVCIKLPSDWHHICLHNWKTKHNFRLLVVLMNLLISLEFSFVHVLYCQVASKRVNIMKKDQQLKKTVTPGNTFFNFFIHLFLIIYFWLCYHSCPDFFPFVPLHPVPPSLRQSPYPCSCSWAMHVISLATPFPILYFISPWLFCNYYLYFLIPSPLIHSPTPALPSLYF